MNKSTYISESYFAAANGFCGFRSNFDIVFSPSKLKKLFILKGGPGTGKSTLMKQIAEHFSNKADITKIFCSSDVKSFDGVLLEKDGVGFGIADGTAPHVIEPKYPGAVEEIINLGDGFDYAALTKRTDEIKELANRKSSAYKRGYAALRTAGEVYKYIDLLLLNYGVYNKAEALASKLTEKETGGSDKDVWDAFLISSFSKDGHVFLPSDDRNKTTVSIYGDGVCEYALMREILTFLKRCGAAQRIYSSPFAKEIIDALESEERVYKIVKKADAALDISEIIPHTDEYLKLKQCFEYFLNEAAIAFSHASEYHFGLEDIYSKNISFEKNIEKKNAIIKSIEDVFNK